MKTPLETANESIQAYYVRREAFWATQVGDEEKKIVSMYTQTIAEAEQAIQNAVSLDMLLFLQSKIAIILDSLGEISAKATSEHHAVKQFIEERFALEYQPAKLALNVERPNEKILKGDIDAALIEKYQKDLRLSVLLEERARIYRAKTNAGEHILESLQNKIIQLRRELERTYETKSAL